jgi:DNA-binding NtrC family response regulator
MPAKPKQKRILIVDDEAIVAFFLMEGLKGLGDEYEVRTTESAERAIEQLVQTPFDLAVIDYRLPGISGLDLIRQLKDISPHTRTIVITAYSSPELEAQAHQLHTCRYMEKPFPIQDLMCTVQEVLS